MTCRSCVPFGILGVLFPVSLLAVLYQSPVDEVFALAQFKWFRNFIRSRMNTWHHDNARSYSARLMQDFLAIDLFAHLAR